VHLDVSDQSERVVDAIRATAAGTEDDIRDTQDDEALTRRALDLLGSRRNDAYELRWRRSARIRGASEPTCSPAIPTNCRRTRNPPAPTQRACAVSWRPRCCRGSRPARPRQKRVGAYRGHFRIQNDRRGLLSDGLFEGFRVGRMRHRIQGIEEGTRR
jgi:hypothetical protein